MERSNNSAKCELLSVMATSDTKPSNKMDFHHLNAIDLNKEIYETSNSDSEDDIELFILELDISEKSKEAQILIALQDSVYQKYLRTNQLKYLSACNSMRRVAYDMLTELSRMEIKCQQREDQRWLAERQKVAASMPRLSSALTVIKEEAEFGIAMLTTRDVGTTTTPADFEEHY